MAATGAAAWTLSLALEPTLRIPNSCPGVGSARYLVGCIVNNHHTVLPLDYCLSAVATPPRKRLINTEVFTGPPALPLPAADHVMCFHFASALTQVAEEQRKPWTSDLMLKKPCLLCVSSVHMPLEVGDWLVQAMAWSTMTQRTKTGAG